jgi:hypothetical protein
MEMDKGINSRQHGKCCQRGMEYMSRTEQAENRKWKRQRGLARSSQRMKTELSVLRKKE